jgi:hypothetical protein
MDQKIQEIILRRGVSLSVLVREILEDNLDYYFQKAMGQAPTQPPVGQAGRGSGEVLIRLGEGTRRALVETAEDFNLDVSAMVQLILTESLPPFVQRGRQFRDRLAEAYEGRQSQQQQPASGRDHERGGGGGKK